MKGCVGVHYIPLVSLKLVCPQPNWLRSRLANVVSHAPLSTTLPDRHHLALIFTLIFHVYRII